MDYGNNSSGWGFYGITKTKLSVLVLPVGDSSALFVVLNKHIVLLKYQLEIQVKSLLKIFILKLFIQAMKPFCNRRVTKT